MNVFFIKPIFAIALLLFTADVMAQVPQGFNFQAVARNAEGELIANAELGVRISVLQGAEDGTAVYTEIQNPTTSAIGSFQIVIGEGTSENDFSAIDWSSDNYYVKLEIDPAGGEEYEVLGTTRLLSVPYALLARDVVNDNGGLDSAIYITQYDLNSSEGDTSFMVNASGATSLAAIRATATTDNFNIGVVGKAASTSANAASQIGVQGLAQGEGTGSHVGTYGFATAGLGGSARGVLGAVNVSSNPSSYFDIGVSGQVFGTLEEPSTFSVAVYGQNTVGGGSEAWGTGGFAGGGGINRAFRGRSNSLDGNESEQFGAWLQANGAGTGNHYGTWTNAAGLGVNYGIYATASGGTENYAGYFEGETVVNGDLTVTGNINYSGDIGSGSGPIQELQVQNEDSEVVAVISSHGPNNNQGLLHIYGETPAGTDNLRAGLEATDNGSGDSWGRMFLRGPVEQHLNFVEAGVSNDPNGSDASGWAGYINIWGKESPNIEMGGQQWHDTNLPFFRMLGNKPHIDGWFHHQLELNVNKDGDQQWGSLSLFSNEGKHNMTLGAKSWEDASLGAGRPYFSMIGNTPDVPNQVWMEVNEGEAGGEFGQLVLSSTNNTEFRFNAYGLYGTETGTGYDRVILEVQNNGNGDSWGSLALKGDKEDRNLVETYAYQDNGDWSGFLQLYGEDSPNIFLKSRSWEDANLPLIELYGNKLNSESGEFYQHAILTVNKDGDQQWGAFELFSNEGKPNITLGAKSWEDPSEGAGRPFISFRGNTPDQDLIWMDVSDDGENEHGGITFRSTNGNEIGINAGGIHGNTDIHGNLHVNGDITYTGSSSQTSDRRLKENIQPLQHGLGTIMKLNPTTYNFRGNGEYNGLKLSTGLHYGLIAQEVEEVLPSLVKVNVHTYSEISSTGSGPNSVSETETTKTMEYKTMNYTELIPVLIKGMQEQQQIIEKQQKEIEMLKSKLEIK